MNKVLVFGSGEYYHLKKSAIKGEVAGFIDNIKEGSIEGKKIYRIEEIKDVEYSQIYIMAGLGLSMLFIKQCIEAGVDAKKLVVGHNLQPHSVPEKIYMHGNPSVFVNQEGIFYNNGKATLRVEDYKEFPGMVEMLGGNVYGFHTDAKDNVVVDIGMNIGVASLYFASREDVSKVYAYEPFSDTYQRAVSNIKRNEKLANKIVPVHAGISDGERTEKVVFHASIHSALTTCPDLVDTAVRYCQSHYGYGADKGCKERIEEIQLLDAAIEVKKILSENEGKNLVLKMDCEGSEYLIMERLVQAGLLQEFSVIMLEWHYKGPDALKAHLQKAGFSYFEFIINECYGTIYAVKN